MLKRGDRVELPERKKNVLKAIVENYILTAEPQGSKSIASELGSFSPATIRHDMSELEEMGFLEKPHVSAGRVPSPMAYRFYVDQLMDSYTSKASEIESLQKALAQKIGELDDIAHSASKILSEITNYTGISVSRRTSSPVFSKIQLIPLENKLSYALIAVTTSSEIKNKVINIDREVSDSEIDVFVDSVNRLLKERSSGEIFKAVSRMMSPMDNIYPLAMKVFDFLSAPFSKGDDVYIDGAVKLLSHPEFKDTSKALRVFDFLSSGDDFSSVVKPSEGKMVNIEISPKTKYGVLDDTAFVFTTYEMGDDVKGIFGVVGPSRMDYAEVSAKLEAFANTVGKYFPVIFDNTKDEAEE